MGDMFILASANQKKIKELNEILKSQGLSVVSMGDIGFTADIQETGDTFEENALIKAKAIWNFCKKPAIADDSGLMVEALGGDPGVYSARYGGEGLDDGGRNQLLLQNMMGIENRRAKFVSVIACVLGEDDIILARGECHGEILQEEQGQGGFGYDPLFFVKSHGKTFAQLTSEEKNQISHRGEALKKFKNELENWRIKHDNK